MRCPFCHHADTQVKDSRPTEDGAVRRRRICDNCGGRFTSFERVQLRELFVLKRDGTKEPFERDKLKKSVTLAVRKRNISNERVDEIISAIIRRFELEGEQDLESQEIGAIVMETLSALDEVAYIRFASVYRDFSGISDFKKFIEQSFSPKKD